MYDQHLFSKTPRVDRTSHTAIYNVNGVRMAIWQLEGAMECIRYVPRVVRLHPPRNLMRAVEFGARRLYCCRFRQFEVADM